MRTPAWVAALTGTQKFFVACPLHGRARKNERNVCCLDCCDSICPRCAAAHRQHRLLQVRRYVYHDVVRREDLEKLIDCSSVQSYTINSSKVVFLKKRPQSRPFKRSGNVCTSCDRSLREPYFHCSLECKVEYILRQEEDLSGYLRPCKTLQLGPDFITPHSGNDETACSIVIDGDEPVGSSDSENLSLLCANSIRKKQSRMFVWAQSAGQPSEDDMTGNMSRRKGVPHRSPLC